LKPLPLKPFGANMGKNKGFAGLFVCLFLLVTLSSFASVDLEDLKRRALGYKGSSLPKKLPDKIPAEVVTPQSRFVENLTRELSEVDKRYIVVHMKLANRHFTRKDYDRANNELDLVFSKDPAHSGARFMRAVISARLKRHELAWYNILMAQEKDPSNDKIKDFIEKLKTVKAQPDPPFWVKDIYRSMPMSACEKCADIIENLLSKQISQNLTKITFGEYSQVGAKVIIPITFYFSTMPARASELKNAIEGVSSARLINENLAINNISYNLEINDLPLINPEAVFVVDLKEFIKGVNEDIDVAIENADEYEPSSGIVRVDYKISVRQFSVLADFLRAVAPYAQKFNLTDMTLSFVTGSSSVIWRTELTVYYLVDR
jgi:hypothetical protein